MAEPNSSAELFGFGRTLTLYILNNNILQLTVLKYTFMGGGGGWVVLD